MAGDTAEAGGAFFGTGIAIPSGMEEDGTPGLIPEVPVMKDPIPGGPPGSGGAASGEGALGMAMAPRDFCGGASGRGAEGAAPP